MAKSGAASITVSWHGSISEIDREQWDALALPLAVPILEWEWLRLLEVSGSISRRTGWQPAHLAIRSGPELVAAAALYLKSHSAGEFVFDGPWAEAAQGLGAPYYPKLVGMSPVTPVAGYRFLIAQGRDEASLTARMVEEIDRLCRRLGLGGSSFLFAAPEWKALPEALGYVSWTHQGFAWLNPGLGSFADYLALFDKNQRRNIRRERAKMESQGITVRVYLGEEVPRSYYTLYARHNARFGPWGAKYLNRAFFEALADSYRHRLLFVAAYREAEGEGFAPARVPTGQGRFPEKPPLAMAFLLTKGDQLYGRYWGSSEPVDSLHFNACFYSPIEWSIAHGIRRFDPGIGAEHKLRRGFRAVPFYSLHRFNDRRLQGLLEAAIGEINGLEQEQIEALNRALPLAVKIG